MSFTDTVENALVEACHRMGYGIDINTLTGRVKVRHLHGLGRCKLHRFSNAVRALGWVEQQERQRCAALARFHDGTGLAP